MLDFCFKVRDSPNFLLFRSCFILSKIFIKYFAIFQEIDPIFRLWLCYRFCLEPSILGVLDDETPLNISCSFNPHPRCWRNVLNIVFAINTLSFRLFLRFLSIWYLDWFFKKIQRCGGKQVFRTVELTRLQDSTLKSWI